MTKSKKYLVTGGTGFIGAALVKRLIAEGHHVRVLDNNIRGHTSRLSDISDNIDLIEEDIRDGEKVANAIKGMDGVFHLAYINGTKFFYSQPNLVLDVGVRGIVNVIDGCIRNEVGELIVASSSEVYQTPPIVPTDENVRLCVPDPKNARYSYGGGKLISEIMALNYGSGAFDRVQIFRPHNVYGPDMGWEHVLPDFAIRMKKLCSENSDPRVEFPIQGDGQETRSFVFINDFIDGLITMVKYGGHREIYNIGTEDEVAISEVAVMVGHYYGRDIIIQPGELPSGQTPRRCPDISKLRSLGYKPRFSLNDGLPFLLEWYDRNAEKAPPAEILH